MNFSFLGVKVGIDSFAAKCARHVARHFPTEMPVAKRSGDVCSQRLR